MTEFELIQLLTRSVPKNKSVVVGPGDDCAVLDFGLPDRLLLFKTDAVVEGVHFPAGAPPEKVGHKALARCLSDIAAMAGTPVAALITIGLPQTFDTSYVEAIYAGMNALGRRHDVAIVDGETTANPERILISVALLGTAPPGNAVLRSGAEVGDAIFVTPCAPQAMSSLHATRVTAASRAQLTPPDSRTDRSISSSPRRRSTGSTRRAFAASHCASSDPAAGPPWYGTTATSTGHRLWEGTRL